MLSPTNSYRASFLKVSGNRAGRWHWFAERHARCAEMETRFAAVFRESGTSQRSSVRYDVALSAPGQDKRHGFTRLCPKWGVRVRRTQQCAIVRQPISPFPDLHLSGQSEREIDGQPTSAGDYRLPLEVRSSPASSRPETGAARSIQRDLVTADH